MIPIETIYALPPTERERELVRECSGLLTDAAKRNFTDDSLARAAAYEILESRRRPDSAFFCSDPRGMQTVLNAQVYLLSPWRYRVMKQDEAAVRELHWAAAAFAAMILGGILWRICQ